jgi:hypothetical protein
MTDKTMEDIKMPTNRPPITGIKMGELAGDPDEKTG